MEYKNRYAAEEPDVKYALHLQAYLTQYNGNWDGMSSCRIQTDVVRMSNGDCRTACAGRLGNSDSHTAAVVEAQASNG